MTGIGSGGDEVLDNQFTAIPWELKSRGLWCLWKYEDRDGKPSKVPYRTNGFKAASNNPTSFTTFDKALSAYRKGGYEGLGIGIFNGFCAVDIDHCVDQKEGTLHVSNMAQDIINTMDSYTEVSPSGTGIRILFVADGFQYDKGRYYINNQKKGLEIYVEGATNKYVTVTGRVWNNRPVNERREQIAAVLEKYMRRQEQKPTPIPTQIRSAWNEPDCLQRGLENDKRLRALWDGHRDTTDESGNDLALMNKLAYWCNRDEELMIDAFLRSPHAASKDETHQRKIQREDYLHSTAQMAISGCPKTAAEDNAAYRWERARQTFADVSQETAAPEIIIDHEAKTAADMLTGETISALFAIPDELAREREIVKLRSVAKEKKFVQDFDNIMKAARSQFVKTQKQPENKPLSGQSVIKLPDIPLQGLICPDGWIVDPLGVRRFCDGSVEWACSHPVVITERLENIDTGIASLTLSFYRDGHWKNVPVKCSTAANRQSIISLADCGVLVNSENARSLVRYLHDLEAANAEAIPLRKSIDRAGWIGDREFFPFSPGYTYDGDAENRRRLNAMVTAGSESVWLEAICKARDENPIFRAMLAVSFSAPLLEPMGNLCFVMHLWGQTGTAKTVATMAAMSVWGDPNILIQSFGGSRVGMERLAAFYHSVPLALDERETNKGSKDDSFDQTIYMLTEGHSAPKGTRTGGLRKSDYWKLPIISTGEAPLVADNSKGGAKNRVLEVRVSENIFPDAPAMADLVKENYGWAGDRWISTLIAERKANDLKDMRTMYKVIYSNLDKENLYTDKQIAAMSLVLLADYYSDQWIFKNDAGNAIKSTLQFAKDMSQYLVTKREADTVESAWNFIQGWIAGNKNHFNSLYDECWGVIEEFDTYVISDVFARALNEAGYNARMCATGFKEKGYIWSSAAEKRLTVKKRINGIPVWCYRLRIKDEVYKSSNQIPSYMT